MNSNSISGAGSTYGVRMAMEYQQIALLVLLRTVNLLESAQGQWQHTKLPNFSDKYSPFNRLVDIYA